MAWRLYPELMHLRLPIAQCAAPGCRLC